MTGNTKSSWGTIARCFHWGLGLAIIGMIAYGWWMNHFPARADRFFYRSIHADAGYLMLLLTVIRLIWRSINPTPDLPDTPRWQRIAARVSHWTLYLVTVLVALLGWAMSGARPPDRNYASFFGWFNVPQFTSPTRSRPAPMRSGTFSSPMCCWRSSACTSQPRPGIISSSATAW
jgi:cytochrome b561